MDHLLQPRNRQPERRFIRFQRPSLPFGDPESIDSNSIWSPKRILRRQQFALHCQIHSGHVHWTHALPTAQCVSRIQF